MQKFPGSTKSVEQLRGHCWTESMKVASISAGSPSGPLGARAPVPFATNTAFVVASQVVKYCLVTATWAIIARLLGPKAVGEIQIAYVLSGLVLLLSNFGLPLANIYFVGKRTYPPPQIVGNIILRWLTETCVVIPLLLLMHGFVVEYIPVSRWVYRAIVCWIPLQSLNSYLMSVLTAEMRFCEQFWINVLQGMTVIVLVAFTIGPLGLGTVGAMSALIAATSIVLLLQLWFLRNHVVVYQLKPPVELIRKCLSFGLDRKSTRLNSSHPSISYAVFCLKKKNKTQPSTYTNTTDPIRCLPPNSRCMHSLIPSSSPRHSIRSTPRSHLNRTSPNSRPVANC